MMTHQDQQVTCTGDVWCGCTCTDCTVTFDHCQPSQHPVDSTYRPCCNVIGDRHASDCSAADGTVSEVDLLLDRAANLAQLLRDDLEDALGQLPDTTPLWSVVDLTAAHGHVLCALKKLDRAAERISGSVVAK